jgi:hypothetical protein
MIIILLVLILLILYITRFNNEYFDNLGECQVIFPSTRFKINDLDINFTFNQNSDGNYDVQMTDNTQNIFPNYNQSGLVMLKCQNDLYLAKASGEWLYLQDDHPNITWKYTLPSMYKVLNNKIDEINKNKIK